MIRIVLDNEFEQPFTNSQCPDSKLSKEKLIQIGYVIVNTETEEILLKRSIFINIRVPLSAFIKQLTGITDENIANGTDILTAYNILKQDREDYKASRIICEWGGGDTKAILIECMEAGLKRDEWAFGTFNDNGLNVKHLFQVWCEANQMGSQGGLNKSMNRLGMKFEGKQHDALTDAENTAKVYLKLMNKMKERM